MQTLWQDLRYGARMLMKKPGFTLIAVLTLALGIGANTALFSIVDAMLLKMLPVREPERLALFQSLVAKDFSYGGYNGSTRDDPVTGLRSGTSFPYLSYQRMREQNATQGALSDVFAFGFVGLNVLADGQAEVASGQAVTGNYHLGLGVQPALGRLLTEEDDKAAADPVAVLSFRYWQKRFGGNAAVVGKQLNLNNRAFTVVGVTPPGFDGAGGIGDTQDVTIPLAWEPQLNDDPRRSRMYGAGQWWLRVMGRLRPGATRRQAQAQLETAFQQSVVEHRAARNAQALAAGGNAISPLGVKDYPRLALASGSQGETDTRAYYAPSLYLLLGVVGMVLLIACANVANLLLSRAAGRQKEIGIRMALGASPRDVLKMIVRQGMTLAIIGVALGLGGAYVLTKYLESRLQLSKMLYGIKPNDPLTYGVVAVLLTVVALIACYLPARRATKVDPMIALRCD